MRILTRIVGTCAAAFKGLEPWTIYGGNPAKPLKPRPRFGVGGGGYSE